MLFLINRVLFGLNLTNRFQLNDAVPGLTLFVNELKINLTGNILNCINKL